MTKEKVVPNVVNSLKIIKILVLDPFEAPYRSKTVFFGSFSDIFAKIGSKKIFQTEPMLPIDFSHKNRGIWVV